MTSSHSPREVDFFYFLFCYIMENGFGSCVRKIDWSYFENVDGMLQPISEETAKAILHAITSASKKDTVCPSREGGAI